MARDLRQKFISAQYIENKLTEFHQILYMHSYWQSLSCDCYTSFFAHLYQSYGPWFRSKFPFHSISWKRIDRISQNFIYALILTRSSLGLLNIIFRTFVPELRSLPTPGRFFFLQKIDFFHFLIFCSTSYYKQNNAKQRKFTVQFKSYSSSLYGLCWLFYAAFCKLIKTSKIFCNSILYLKIVISNKHAKP